MEILEAFWRLEIDVLHSLDLQLGMNGIRVFLYIANDAVCFESVLLIEC